MKKNIIATFGMALSLACAEADPAKTAEPESNPKAQQDTAAALEKHREGSKKLATEQDDLSADVQDMIDEQTDPEVIKLLHEVEETMADATDQLESTKTDGSTIAIETEIIEKIFEAAKKKQQNGKGKGSSKSMLEMMQRMMEGGKDVTGEGEQPGEKPGRGGDKPGQGGSGGGESSGKTGAPDNTAENNQRRVPRSSGNSGSALPREFQKAMDAYNKGAAAKAKKSK